MVEQILSSRKRDQVKSALTWKFKVGGRGCVEADGAPKVVDPVRLDRGLVVSTVVCFD
jgi:hypothetical protein